MDWHSVDGYEVYVVSEDTGREHELSLDLSYTIGNDSIGAYEFWGERCFDCGRDYIEDVDIHRAYLVREVCVLRKEAIPRIKGILRKWQSNGAWWYLHGRMVNPDAAFVEFAVDKFRDEYDFTEDTKEAY